MGINEGNFKTKFLNWLQGLPPPPLDALEHSRRPTEEEQISKYHTKTIKERWYEWKANRGTRVFNYIYNAFSVIFCISLVTVLLFTVSALPKFGEAENPTNNELSQRYIEEGLSDTGAINLVAGVLLDYRAFDTFGESLVLFTAVCAILIILHQGEPIDAFDAFLREMEEPRPNIILQNTAFLLVAMMMIFGFYVIVNGHLSPGGGFSGGAILGSSLALYAIAYGTRRARFFNYKIFQRVVSVCLAFYGMAKGISFFTGANKIAFYIPLGTPGSLFSAGLILPLNIAVGLTVASTLYVIYILFSRGEFS